MANFPRHKPSVQETIRKTLLTARLFEGFWDRWIAHGIEKNTATEIRRQVKSLAEWIEAWKTRAEDYERRARFFQDQHAMDEAEYHYRVAGLHYYLIQWIFPETGDERRTWFARCKRLFRQADAISKDHIREAVIRVDEADCPGRIRAPERPKGCVIIINPMDSSKEELFTYEMDFARMGFVTVSFDGPGQGESYVFCRSKATRERWDLFVNQVIDFTAAQYPELKICLFGTSSGAAWAIRGSGHPKVSKAVSVSPACKNDVKLPDYFTERMSHIVEKAETDCLPALNDFEHFSPVFLFHGKKDVMVRDEDISALYNKLPQGKRLVEYENEGHCCNFALSEIRKISAEWYLLED